MMMVKLRADLKLGEGVRARGGLYPWSEARNQGGRCRQRYEFTC